MAQNNSSKKQVSATNKDRKGDTGRTSNQGRKTASGGKAPIQIIEVTEKELNVAMY